MWLALVSLAYQTSKRSFCSTPPALFKFSNMLVAGRCSHLFRSFPKQPARQLACQPVSSGPVIKSSFHKRFHAASQRQSQFLDICLHNTHTVIAGLHSVTGLPWVLSLPLTGLLVRLIFITPLQLYSQKQLERQLALSPLIYAWSHIIRRRALSQHAAKGKAFFNNMVAVEFMKKTNELQKSMGVNRLGVLAPLLQFPIWLLFIETIRKMCGTHEGLLGLATRPFSNSEGDTAAGLASSVESTVVPLEPSMATEGALWFSDLLVPDPLLILPIILSASMFANISYQEKLSIKRHGDRSKWNKRVSRILKLVALAVVPLTLNVPSAMLVYWSSSALTALGQAVLMNHYFPIPPKITPCKPKRLRVF